MCADLDVTDWGPGVAGGEWEWVWASVLLEVGRRLSLVTQTVKSGDTSQGQSAQCQNAVALVTMECTVTPNSCQVA